MAHGQLGGLSLHHAKEKSQVLKMPDRVPEMCAVQQAERHASHRPFSQRHRGGDTRHDAA